MQAHACGVSSMLCIASAILSKQTMLLNMLLCLLLPRHAVGTPMAGTSPKVWTTHARLVVDLDPGFLRTPVGYLNYSWKQVKAYGSCVASKACACESPALGNTYLKVGMKYTTPPHNAACGNNHHLCEKTPSPMRCLFLRGCWLRRVRIIET